MGIRLGGRQKGAKNKTTLRREAVALQAALEAAKIVAKQPGGTKLAVAEMQKALALSEGLAGKLQPKFKESADGKVIIEDVKAFRLFGEWFDRWFRIQQELAKYQTPPMRAIEAPAPAPDANETNRKVFTLRVFDGGRQVGGPGAVDDGIE